MDALDRLDLQGDDCDDGKDFGIDAILAREVTGESDLDTSLSRQVDDEVDDKAGRLRRQVEGIFLTPSTNFSDMLLNRLQQRWDCPVDYAELFQVAPAFSRTVTRFTRQGIEGRVVGYKNATVAAASETAKNSTSMLRRPGTRSDFIRGAAGFFPFSPGGLDSIEATATYEDRIHRVGEAAELTSSAKLERIIKLGSYGKATAPALLELAPGFERGIKFPQRDGSARSDEAKAVEQELDKDPEQIAGTDATTSGEETGSEEQDGNGEKEEEDEEEKEKDIEDFEDIDDILPVEFPSLAPRGGVLASSSVLRAAGHEWAHMVNVNRPIGNLRELVPDMARDWPFELDTFQKEAIYHLENGDSVFVAAHTSAGKTVVAEYAIALAAKHMTKAIYTSPIKALSNQKFRDFRQTFDEVGILTGDVQINAEAGCVIMTTEILRSMLYRGADLIRDVEFVIFDEVHYVNDFERGVVWEEVIIMLPDHVSLILLSATVPNTYEFASWVGRTKKKKIYVISTTKRPVPLEHHLWTGQKLHKIVEDGKFIEQGWKAANAACQGKDNNKNNMATKGTMTQQSQSGTGSSGSGSQGSRGGVQRGGLQRGDGGGGVPQRGSNSSNSRGFQRGSGRQQRGRGGPPRASHTPGHMGRAGRPGGMVSVGQDRNLWVHLVHTLRKNKLLPACIFIFSKKRCEQNADALSNQDYCTSQEKSAVHNKIERSISRLRPEDRVLPQIIRMRELLGRGIGVHHSGLLPIVKEIVEMLFAETLVKVLFATETFAMGLNLPTRTVVFSGCRKHDGHSFRNLLPGEYTQMAGRAGRRGIDTVGTVIIVPPGGGGIGDEAPPAGELQRMILGEPSKLRSQFRLTYNMILNLLRVEALKIEEMIKRSFSEHATQQLLPENEQLVRLSEADLAKVRREACARCDDVDDHDDGNSNSSRMDTCHQAAQDYRELTGQLYRGLIKTPLGRKMLGQGRLIVYRREGVRTPGILLADGVIGSGSGGGSDRVGISKGGVGGEPTLHVCEIRTVRTTRDDTDLLPYLARFRALFTALPHFKKQVNIKTLHVALDDVECITECVTKGIVPQIFQGGGEHQTAKEAIHQYCSGGWTSGWWNEVNLTKINSLELLEVMEKRKEVERLASTSAVVECRQFLKHFAMCHDQWLIKEHISQLRQSVSDENLQLLPDYEQRIQVLKELGFIDGEARILLKGKVACEMHSGDELVLTELVLDNGLAEFDAAEAAALLSAFVFREKTEAEPTLTASLERGRRAIVGISEKVNRVQTLHQVIQTSSEGSGDENDFVSRPRFGLVEVVYEWARGMTFKNITGLTDVLEGTIVRAMTRLDETCREVKNAARIVGDPGLYQKMQTAQELIKRDITAVASLYM